MDFVEEFNEVKTVSPWTVATYSFFKPFKVNVEKRTLQWHGYTTDIAEEYAEASKKYLSFIKKEVKDGMKAGGCSRAMFFWFGKLQEMHVFSSEIRTEILKWMEVCELICT